MKMLHALGVSLSVAIVCGSSALAQNYAFTTWAGKAASGIEDGPVATARLNRPYAVAVDAAGNLYVAEPDSHTIRKIGVDGVVRTLAGMSQVSGAVDGVGSAARFYYPFGITVDSAGNLYVADSSNQTIRRIDPSGSVTTIAGSTASKGSLDGTGSMARFNNPIAIKIEPQTGNLIVVDRANHTIRRVTPAGVVTTVAGKAGVSGSADGAAADARFNGPYDIAPDGAGNIYVLDAGNFTIRKIAADGQVTTVTGSPGVLGYVDGQRSAVRLGFSSGLCIDRNGDLWLTQYVINTIRRVTPAGAVSTVIGSSDGPSFNDATGRAAGFVEPRGIAADASGNLFVADSLNHSIRKVTSSGAVTTVAGQGKQRGHADEAGMGARFNSPRGMAADDAGNVYLADEYNNVVRKISPSGVVSTILGHPGHSECNDGTVSEAHLHRPFGVGVDGAGNVYAVDFVANTVRKLDRDGNVTTLAGKTHVSGSDDGDGVLARFSGPEGIAVSRSGVVYVADTFNHTIRRVDTGGRVMTIAGKAGETGSEDGSRFDARFYRPRAIAVDSKGVVYVADSGNYTIRRISLDGQVTTLAGTAGMPGIVDGQGAAARLGEIWGLSVDGDGVLYAADSTYRRIRRVTASGAVTTIGGNGYMGSDDGIGAMARFRDPCGIAVSPSGDVYVADGENNTIRVGRALDQKTQTCQLMNLSVRADMVANERLIVGFVVNGEKPVLVRAIGPGLQRFLPALTTVAQDPVLEVYNSLGGVVENNDNWGGTETLTKAFNRLGAFALDGTSQDAAVLRTMAGTHTAHFSAKASGVGLMEAYDAEDSKPGRFANLSARYRASSGTGSLIAGFSISGTGLKTVLIRAVGPQLAKFGASNTLADPRLDIFDSQGRKVGENDQWSSSLASVFTKVSAFAFDNGSKDAAVLLSLPPGLYSAQVSGVDGAAGEAMVEVYEIP